MTAVNLTPWTAEVPPNRLAIEKAFAAEGLSPYAWSNAPGDLYTPHSHTYNKVLYCISGSITFTLPDLESELVLKPGDRLDLPALIKHGARVGPEGVTCMEAHD